MLHHEESPEKSQYNVATPQFLDNPPPPQFCLPPPPHPTSSKNFQISPPHFPQFWKSRPTSLYEGWVGGRGGGESELWRMLKTTEKTSSKSSSSICFSFLLFIFVIKSFSHCPKGLMPLLYLVDFRLSCFTQHISALRHASAVNKPCFIPNFVNIGSVLWTPSLQHMAADATVVLSTELPT